ncbi:translation protein SH3-like domain-containing protein, partial [Lasiosphaeria miniovina]
APLARQPLGCLKAGLRQARQQRLFRRQLATAATKIRSRTGPGLGPLPEPNFYKIQDPKTGKIRTAFAVYNPPSVIKDAHSSDIKPKPVTEFVDGKPVFRLPWTNRNTTMPKVLTAPVTDPLPALHAAQIERLDPTGARTAMFAKTKQGVRAGDILTVTHRRGGEPFSGVCLSIRRAGIDTAILLRNHLSKVGVEMWFKIYNRNVAGIELVKRRLKRARRARLTFMRQPKHDMGSVSEIVHDWRASRKVFTS